MEKTNQQIIADVITYAEEYLRSYNETIRRYYLKPAREIEGLNFLGPFLRLYKKELGKTLSLAAFCGDYDFYLFFIKPIKKKIKKVEIVIGDKKYGKEWSDAPLKIRYQSVVSKLKLARNEIIQPVSVGGTPFILQDSKDIKRNAAGHGKSRGEVDGETAIHSLPQLKRQDKHTKTLISFRKRYQDLKTDTKSSPQQIGIDFEGLWRDILDYYEWKPKKIRLAGEENDFTAIYQGHHILGEVRWQKEPLNGNGIRAFAAKLDPRPLTIGLIISYSGFDEGAYAVARRVVHKKTLVFFGPEQIEKIIDRFVSPGEAFEEELRSVYDQIFEK